MKSRFGVYSNTSESHYYIEFEQFKLFFSSKTVMQKFAMSYKGYVQAEYDKFINRYNVNEKAIDTSIIKLCLLFSYYKMKEKRGYKVLYKEKGGKEWEEVLI